MMGLEDFSGVVNSLKKLQVGITWVWEMMATPQKTNMEPENDGF